ncbi:hypothetical protein POTOM_011240 [Populus tomentosa]|uniref:CCHC-type domain-containing protein n=1 Tax=Populus tomentosa TaxID=118781 RepID=A0A8X8A878_POPTO|nr:hypothetical protein POTOM_011240 [Populus tomentosa]
MGDLQVIGGIKKLNNQNYNTWSTCMMSYMQGQDLWEVVNGCEITQPEAEDANDLFSKKNDTKLQLLESELLSIAQRELTVAQFFHKVKTLCREISELDAEAPIGETRMKRIIIHGLRPDFRSFVAAVQGWQTQPSLVEFENLLAGQEALAKQMGEVALKGEVDALYVHKGRWKPKQHANDRSKRNEDKTKFNREERNSSEARGYGIKRKFEGKCYNCGKKGHMAKDCWQKKEHVEGNTATFKIEDEWDAHAFFTAVEEEECLQRKEHVENDAVTFKIEDEWDAHAFFAEVKEAAFTVTTPEHIDYEKDWIIDSGCSNHMTDDKEKLKNLVEYKGKHVVVTANNSKLAIAHVGDAVVSSQLNLKDVSLQNVYHVPGMKKNLFLDEPVIKGQRLESVYVMSAQTTYVDKTRKSETVDLWHQRLSHVSFSKLNMMMRRNVVFDESSSWWSIEHQSLPDSEGLKEEMQIARIQLNKDKDNTDSQEEVIDVDAEIKENPWQTGIHDQPSEEFNAATTSNPPRRSTRMKKPNAKYANAAVVEGLGLIRITEADVEGEC